MSSIYIINYFMRWIEASDVNKTDEVIKNKSNKKIIEIGLNQKS